MRPMRMSELEEQPRLAKTRFSYDTDHLAMVCACLFKRFAKLLGFSIASDEASKSSRGCRLQARARGSNSGNFINFHRLS